MQVLRSSGSESLGRYVGANLCFNPGLGLGLVSAGAGLGKRATVLWHRNRFSCRSLRRAAGTPPHSESGAIWLNLVQDCLTSCGIFISVLTIPPFEFVGDLGFVTHNVAPDL